MDFSRVMEKQKLYEKGKDTLHEVTVESNNDAGNGRTSRLIMNYQLMSCGYLPISIAKENRLNYYNALDKYAAEGILDDFTNIIVQLEEVQLNKYISMISKES